MRFKKSVVNIGSLPYNVVQFNYTPPKDKDILKNRTHFIQILDRSGSMAPHIDELIENVKKTTNVMGTSDLLSVIWFSGPGEYKVLLKGASPNDPSLKKQLDTLKSTLGITCFSEAVKEAEEVINDLKDLCGNFVISLFTDGQPVVPWSIKEEENRVKKIICDINEKIISFNTIGYGGYYNSEFLKEIASLSKCGRHAHSTKINEYLPIFSHNLKSVEDMTALKLDVKAQEKDILYLTGKLSKLIKNNLRINLSSKSINRFYIISPSYDEFQFEINEKIYDSSKIKTKLSELDTENLLYALAYEKYYSGNSDEALDILTASLSDKYLTEIALNAFTAKERQKCTDALLTAVHNKKINLGPRLWAEARFLKGNLAEGEIINNGACFMDLLEVFEKNGDKFIPLSSENYKRIGKKVIDNYNAFKIDKAVKLTADFKDLVFSKEKLNISIRYEIKGYVTINPRQAKAVGLSTNVFNARIYREQTIIKDGDINIDKFKALITKDTMNYLNKLNISGLYVKADRDEYLIPDYTLVEMDISKLPVLNRSYIFKTDSLDYILDTYYEQRTAECRQKVIKYYIEKENCNLKYKNSMYTEQQSELLKEYGFDANGIYSGIDNKVASQGTDQYECRYFEFALKGFSNLPKIEDLICKINEGKKLNKPETLMASYIAYIKENNLQSSLDKLNKLLDEQKSIIRKNTRILAQIKLAKALTGSWWQGLKLDAKDNYIYEREDNTLIVKVVKKIINI